MKHFIFIFLISLLFLSCNSNTQQDNLFNKNMMDSETLTEISSAQKFFEESVVVRSRSSESSVMEMGNMIVDWENAIVEETEHFKIVSATFRSEYCLKVERIPAKEDSTKNYRVSAWQRLLVYTHKDSGKKKYFFQTFIPEKNYFKMYKHPDWSNFTKISSYPGYSGYVMFTDGMTHEINLLSFYRDGILKYRASTAASNESRSEHIKFINSVFRTMHLHRYTNSISRSNEEIPVPGAGGTSTGEGNPSNGGGNDNIWDDLDEGNTGGGAPSVPPVTPTDDNGVVYTPGGNNVLMSNNVRVSTGIDCYYQHSVCACISYVLFHYNRNVSTKSIINNMEAYYSDLDLIDNLIYPTDLSVALKEYFNIEKLSYITNALYNHRFSISVFHPYGDEDFSRAVVIVGENSTERKLIYWDPLYDYLMKRPIEDFDMNYSYDIRSAK